VEVFFNPTREREIQLRGHKIGVIENLGATQDQFDCIDLSDNEISKVDGFPLLQRLRTLLFNNNTISKIEKNLEEFLPHLDTLVLTNNRLTNLSDIDPLSTLSSLRSLSLLENMITKKPHYRLYVIHKLPHLRILDFRKIKEKERLASEKLFGASTKPKQKAIADVLKSNDGKSQKTLSDQVSSNGLTPQDVLAIKNAIKNATSMEEVSSLERSLAMGQIPASLKTHTPMETEGIKS